MSEANTDEGLDSDEVRNKAESLFSEKFREYLITKKSSTSHNLDKSYAHSHNIKPFAKDYSESSSETTSESSKKSSKKARKKVQEKKSYWNIQYSLRNRLVQCSLLQSEEEVVIPEELKPLLMNITALLQDFKQSPSEFENLYTLISKITLLMSQFVRRPLQKIPEESKSEHMKSAQNTVNMIMTLLDEYKNETNLDSDNSMREYKRIEKEITNKDQEIAEMKTTLLRKAGKPDLKVKDLELRVKNSILINENLKFDIKFNQNRLKKYRKVLMEKEWTKHKLETELAHLRKKVSLSKADLSDNESLGKQTGSSEPSLKNEMFSKMQMKNTNTKMKKVKRIVK